MSQIITKFELFLEKKVVYTNSKIRSLMKEAINKSFNGLKKKVKEAKNIEEVKAVTTEIVKEINHLKEHLKGTIVYAINEAQVNEAIDIAASLNGLKNTIKELLHRKSTPLEIAKKEAIAKIDKVKSDLIKFVKEIDIDIEKTNAKLMKYKGDVSYEPTFLI